MHDSIFFIIAHIWLCNMRFYFSSPNKYIWGRLRSLMLSSIFAPQKVLLIVVPACGLTIERTNESVTVGGLLDVSSNRMHPWCLSKLPVFFFLLWIPHLSARWRPIIKYSVYLPLLRHPSVLQTACRLNRFFPKLNFVFYNEINFVLWLYLWFNGIHSR